MKSMIKVVALLPVIAMAAPMYTEWGERVTSENAWREYPRPQMVRDGWTCLNGDWDYAVTSVTNTPGRPERWDGKIRVPFALEAPLSGVERYLESDQFLWYTRTITVHPQKGFRTLLHFDGVDFRAQVYIGHNEVTDVPHAGAQEPFTLDITDYVKDGDNELTVCVWDPTDDFIQSRGKQERKPYGCHYTRVSGIWQSVWMETVPEAYIVDYSVTPDLEAGAVSLKFRLSEGSLKDGAAKRGSVRISFGGKTVADGSFGLDGACRVKLPSPVMLWSPEAPHLYSFDAQFVGDRISGYFGMRSFGVKKDAKGILRFHLNGKPYFPIGTLDQGWWPDGLLTPPSDAAMRFDIEALKSCGFNMMRKHIKVEPRRYYYLCDTIGILVFQDLPSCGSTWRAPMSSEIVKRYGLQRHELKAMVDNLRNVPSIVAWVPYNEGWGQPGEHLTHATLDFLRRYDRTRVVSGPSGCWDWEGGHLLPKGWKWENRVETTHKPVGVCEAADTVDMHLYRGPTMFAVNERRASFLGEFGGLGHAVSNHVWQSERKIWGYGGVDDTSTREGLLKTYLGLMDRLTELASNGLAGSVYTQTTDVENEINGLLTYDRKVLKYDAETLRKAHARVVSAAMEGK